MTDRAIVRIFESELAVVIDETRHHPEIETGGSLFGLWTNAGSPTIFLATRPGPNAIHHVTQFEQDVETHYRLDEISLKQFGTQSLGLWHSHHQIGLEELSSGDVA